MAVINSPFESQYGFKGPGFSVDSLGNITANSIITVSSEVDTVEIVNFTLTEVAGAYSIAEVAGANPTITVSRSSSYKFGLTLPTLGFRIYSVFPTTLYNTGLTHSDGSTGVDAQGKTTGVATLNVSLTAPNTLYYGDSVGNVYGTINVVDPIGRFSTIDINSTINATDSVSGALTIAGGASVEKDLYIGGSLNIAGVGVSKLDSPTNLELNADNKIVLSINNVKLGELNSSGLAVTINNSTIDNTVIGSTTPAEASFTTATVEGLPTTDNGVSNKQYVDSTALALSIAFGL